MADLKTPALIHAKGLLFLLLALLAGGVLIAEHPTLRFAGLLAIAVWAACRFYYYVFYVVEHYVDRRYRFAGLWSFVVYLVRGPRPEHEWPTEGEPPDDDGEH